MLFKQFGLFSVTSALVPYRTLQSIKFMPFHQSVSLKMIDKEKNLIDVQKETSVQFDKTLLSSSNEEQHLDHQREVFDEMSEFFASDEATAEEIVPILEFLCKRILSQVKHSRKSSKLNILDIGCGTGALFPFYVKAAEELNLSISITGVDLSPRMVQAAKKRLRLLLPASDSKIIEGDFVALAKDGMYEDRYDCAVTNACFGNFFDGKALLDAKASSLKPNGKLFITHPLGKSFVEKLHESDNSMVPHLLPQKYQLEEYANLSQMELDDFTEEKVAENNIYFASLKKCDRM